MRLQSSERDQGAERLTAVYVRKVGGPSLRTTEREASSANGTHSRATRACLQTRIGWGEDGVFSRAAHDGPCRGPVKSAPKLDKSWAITSKQQFADTP